MQVGWLAPPDALSIESTEGSWSLVTVARLQTFETPAGSGDTTRVSKLTRAVVPPPGRLPMSARTSVSPAPEPDMMSPSDVAAVPATMVVFDGTASDRATPVAAALPRFVTFIVQPS